MGALLATRFLVPSFNSVAHYRPTTGKGNTRKPPVNTWVRALTLTLTLTLTTCQYMASASKPALVLTPARPRPLAAGDLYRHGSPGGGGGGGVGAGAGARAAAAHPLRPVLLLLLSPHPRHAARLTGG